MLRAKKLRGLANLDTLKTQITYLSLSTVIMQQAAIYWALARQRGRPTAPGAALDADMILAATA